MLSLVCALSAYSSPVVSRPQMTRSLAPSMKVINFDQDGQFDSSSIPDKKPPVKILRRVEELRVLSSVAEAGLLSAAEDAGVFSKLENAGAFSKAEKLLPLADDLKLLSTAENLLNADSNNLLVIAAALLGAELGLVLLVPDDSGALVAIQVITALLAGVGAGTLFGISSLFSVLQAED